MDLKVLVDCTHTAHCTANTGVQRVVRRIFGEFSARGDGVPVVFDPHYAGWRPADTDELALLRFDAAQRPGVKRGAVWSARQKLRGVAMRCGWMAAPEIPSASAALLPEVFGAPRDADAFRRLRTRVVGPLVAVFHDLIPLQLPDETPPDTLVAFRGYLETLKTTDLVIAVSEASREALLDHWKKCGETRHPPVYAVCPGTDLPPGGPSPLPPRTGPTRILCVGSLEGRKNHVALLDAAESLWRDGVDFELELVGLAHAVTGRAAVEKIDRLKRQGRPLIRHGAVSDNALEAAYARCHFTVYPSRLEGFGLPVIESLVRGRPCVCSGLNAMAETARAGGCELTGEPTAEALARAMGRLCRDSARLEALAAQARERPHRSWADYAKELRALVIEHRREPGR